MTAWLDYPIIPGDRFIPLTRCLVLSTHNTWIFEPEGGEVGRWQRAPIGDAEGGWRPYGALIFSTDGDEYRISIFGVGRVNSRYLPTGYVATIEGTYTIRASEATRGSGLQDPYWLPRFRGRADAKKAAHARYSEFPMRAL